jgi:hypothetical protein
MKSELLRLERFRDQVYRVFAQYPDTVMDLLDSLASNQSARSVAELSLNPVFRRAYSSLYQAVAELVVPTTAEERLALEASLISVVAELLVPAEEPAFWPFALDGLSLARLYAATLTDRSYVHWPEQIKSKLPVTVGHGYSILTALPADEQPEDAPWAVPLSSRRVASQEGALAVGVAQVRAILANPKLPWHGKRVVLVIDSLYSVAAFLGPLAGEDNLVNVSRLRSNRVLYRQPGPKPPGKRGRAWFGAAFKLGDPTTWGEPDERVELPDGRHLGRPMKVRLEVWHDLLMRGTRAQPMHQCPFTVLRVVCQDAEGQPIYKQAMWLVVSGQRRAELNPAQAYAVYRRRSHQEHTHRFGRQRLLLDAFQTPDTAREENWLMLVGLAYAQLFAARHLADHLPRPWERSKPAVSTAAPRPSLVQRDFGRILGQLGTPARAPKRRGIAPGRAKGASRPRRQRWPVVFKGRKRRRKAPKAA